MNSAALSSAVPAALAGGISRFEQIAYILAALLFIAALSSFSHQKSALRGNGYGIAGMAIALVATVAASLLQSEAAVGQTVALMVAAVAIGCGIGVWKARSVQMTGMPELVAMLHSFVGAAAVLVGFNSFITQPGVLGGADAFHMGEVGLAVFIGAVTFTGSIVAYLKLSGKISGRALALPGRNAVNAAMLAACIAIIAWFAGTVGQAGWLPFGILTAVSLVLGAHLVLAIGGGDMPVVVSMLNSLSGWAAAMAGFTLGNDLLIVTGALVGSSGAYLSSIMCKGMNRSFASVILGGYGAASSGDAPGTAQDLGDYTEVTPEDVARDLAAAERVVIAPGYGMAVAHAQFAVADLTRKLQSRGIDVRFDIHPVAGRMPGHMNVLLAEAKVPYDSVFEMDEIDGDFAQTDVVLVIGANDTVNPAAETEPDSPIAGMPVMHVWEAREVVVLKRSMGNAGYAGVQNPLFFRANTRMLLGDAKDSVEAIAAAL